MFNTPRKITRERIDVSLKIRPSRSADPSAFQCWIMIWILLSLGLLALSFSLLYWVSFWVFEFTRIRFVLDLNEGRIDSSFLSYENRKERLSFGRICWRRSVKAIPKASIPIFPSTGKLNFYLTISGGNFLANVSYLVKILEILTKSFKNPQKSLKILPKSLKFSQNPSRIPKNIEIPSKILKKPRKSLKHSCSSLKIYQKSLKFSQDPS